jgi:transposase
MTELSVSVSICAPITDDRTFQVIEAATSRLDASPLRPRRRWSEEAKRRLIEESFKPGANVSAIAREAGMAPSQLFNWRRQALASGAASRWDEGNKLGFVEVSATRSSLVEIDLGGIDIRAGADIGQDQLVRLIRAVRAA